MWSGITNKMLTYADDTSLYADIPFSVTKQTVADSLTVDLMIIQSWGMKLNPTISKEIIVSRSKT